MMDNTGLDVVLDIENNYGYDATADTEDD